jgi:acetyl-CoA C-acetyltransferase
VIGCVTPVGDPGGDIAKAAAHKAGLPYTIPGMQINRFCAYALYAANLAASKVDGGSEELLLAGGVESMSRVSMGATGACGD